MTTLPIPTMHPDDPLHVILDALTQLLHLIGNGEVEPWNWYLGDDDPKTTRGGYMSVLAFAHAYVEGELSAKDGWRPKPS